MAIQSSTTGGLRELALFAGAGGGILGGLLLGWRTVCAVERDAYCAAVLAQRQDDGILAPFPIWSDVETFDGREWRGLVDVVSGGFPCQDISCAGQGKGLNGERSGLWTHMARVVREVQPRYVFVENSPAITTRGLGRVLGDLAAAGFDADWDVLGTKDTGGECWGERMWIVATPNKDNGNPRMGPVQRARRKQILRTCKGQCEERTIQLRVEMSPRAARMDTQVAWQMERVASIGNGQDPYLAATAWRILNE